MASRAAPARTLEHRLDQIDLAGATPPRGLRVPMMGERALVPLRLEAPRLQPPRAPATAATSSDAAPQNAGPSPRVLQFLGDEPTDAGAGPLGHRDATAVGPSRAVVDDASDATSDATATSASSAHTNPWARRRIDARSSSNAELLRSMMGMGISTNSFRLADFDYEATPARPLPAVASLPGDNAATADDDDDLFIELRAFSSRDTRGTMVDDAEADDDFEEPMSERAGRSPAALALKALSEEGDPIAALEESWSDEEDLDALAAALGLPADAGAHENVDRPLDEAAFAAEFAPPGVIGGPSIREACPLLDEFADDMAPLLEVDAADVLSEQLSALHVDEDPFADVRVARTDVDALLDDDERSATGDYPPAPGHDDVAPHAPRASQPFGSLVFGLVADGAKAETVRPALEAPHAVRIVTPRPTLVLRPQPSVEDTRERAHDLYLVAVEDLASNDVDGAICHLELAIAYDDANPLYLDLLLQLRKRRAREQAAREDASRPALVVVSRDGTVTPVKDRKRAR